MAINMSYFAGAGAQFFDDNGVPLAGGKLYTYSAGTTTPAVTYTTRAGTVNNTNPIILDAAGRTPNEIWFNGGLFYKFVLKSSTDVLIGSYDNISSINDVSQTTNLITVTGTNDLTGTSVVPVTAYSAGFQVSFVAVATNTGPMTIDIDTTGAKSIVTDVSTPLAAGDVPIGKVVYLEYDGTRFQVINPAAFKNIRITGNATIGGNASITGNVGVGGVLNLAQGSNVASASTIDLTSVTGNSVHVTGTTTINTITLTQGYQRTVIFDGVLTLTNSASLVLPNGVNITTSAGDSAVFIGDAASVVRCVSYSRAPSVSQIQPISASVGSNALTISASLLSLDFRSTTLGSGTVTRVTGTPANLVVPASATLGTVNAVQSKLAVLAINNAGTIELAVVNLAGGNQLDETNLLTTTTISSGATSASTVYSTTGRTNVAYRVIGYIESTQSTAGTWATSPSTVQGQGGQAITAMSTLGYGQTWQDVTASRTQGVTYYNTTGKPIQVVIASSAATALNILVNGVTRSYSTSSGGSNSGSVIVPPGASYSATNGTLVSWNELR